VHSNDFTPLLAFDVNSGQMVALAYDGTNFQLVWSSSGLRTAQGVLQANYDFYVNGTTGNDTTYDGTQDTVGVAGHGPFKTIMKAATSASKLNANGYVITVHVANGTYPESVFITFQTNGLLRFMGNPASPASCVVTGSPTQPNGACFQARGTGVGFWVEGFKVLPSHPSGTYGFVSQINSSIDFQNIDFGAAGAGHMLCDTGSMACNGDYTISGAAQFHIAVEFATFVLTPNRVPPTVNSIVNITAGFNFSQAFVFGWGNGFLRCDSRTIFSGAAGSVTGQRFNVSANATIYTSGAGVNFFPGNVAGVTATGGQYV
jgi:hypothetical protein